MKLAHLRREYDTGKLLERDAPSEPFALFARWLARALRVEPFEPTAMTLATVSARGLPSARMVLLKDAGPEGLTFFTNYTSRKARELASGRAALVLYWPRDHRQVRIEGTVERLPRADSDAYFAQRPRGSRIAAWASPQSRVIRDRASLERGVAAITARYRRRDLPRPASWGGYRLAPEAIEFWQGRRSRLHDRLLYVRDRRGWKRSRLAP